jgi:hypothetical protein
MGDYAQDAIDRGDEFFDETDFYDEPDLNSKSTKPSVPIKPSISDDYFTWWFDELMSSEGFEKLSKYEIASLAWNEAIDRIKSS